MFKVEKEIYGCDGGGLKIANSSGCAFTLMNDVGDGDHTLYVVHASG